jgi:hypothetical protein
MIGSSLLAFLRLEHLINTQGLGFGLLEENSLISSFKVLLIMFTNIDS